MNKEQFRKLVEGLDLENLYWSEQLMSIQNPIINSYLSEINTVYVIFNPRTQKVEKIIYSTPKETYIYTNFKEVWNGKFLGLENWEWYYEKIKYDENGDIKYGKVTYDMKRHPFRYRNIPINLQNEGRGWSILTRGSAFILNIGMRKWMNWDKEPWSDLK